VSRTRAPKAPPEDLSHIAEGLRPLAAPIDAVRPDPANAMEHPEDNRRRIRESLRAYGQRKPVVANRATMLIEAGNGTWEEARALGWTRIAVLFVDDDPAAATGYAIADNRAREGSRWNDAKLADLLASLRAEGGEPAMERAGFDRADFDDLLERLRPPATDDGFDARRALEAAPELAADAGPGAVWALGRHRLACGDATDPATYERLMRGDRADSVWTDPPYGVSYESRATGEAIAGDDFRRDELAGFLTAAFKAAARHARPDAAWYVWHASSTREDYALALRRAGLREIAYIVWAKPSATLGRGDYRQAHEPCFYAARDGESPPWRGGRDQGTVWRASAIAPSDVATTALAIGPGVLITDGAGRGILVTAKEPKGKVRHVRLGPGEAAILEDAGRGDGTLWEVGRDAGRDPDPHPTQKPVELAVRALRNSTAPGGIALDPFAGSGTLMIAAEREGRAARLIELDPRWCAVAVARWEALTGLGAEPLEHGTAPPGPRRRTKPGRGRRGRAGTP
jgi:DNA modification methylase